MTEPASFCDLAKASRDLETTTRCIWDMVEQVAEARVVKEFHTEAMKQALSKAVIRSAAKSIAQGEVIGRCDQKYQDEIMMLRAALLAAEKVLGRNAAYHARQEGLRTLISAQKQTLKDI